MATRKSFYIFFFFFCWISEEVNRNHEGRRHFHKLANKGQRLIGQGISGSLSFYLYYFTWFCFTLSRKSS